MTRGMLDRLPRSLTLCTISFLLGMTGVGCTTTTVDEYREDSKRLDLKSGETIVVLGRRHAAQYETEPDFIECIGDKIGSAARVDIVAEPEFMDATYPWFEPRTAPLGLKRMGKMLGEPMIAERIRGRHIRYMIWVDGSTETTDREGSVSCAIGPGGGGCFGFATWEKEAVYEAVIWDLSTLLEQGRVRVKAKGSSYMVAVGLPVPIIAQVQGQACEGIGNQLGTFFPVD